MNPENERKLAAREEYITASQKLLDQAAGTHDLATVKESLHKLFVGWVSTPLELSPEERLDMVVHYEFLQEHLSDIEKLKEDTDCS